MVTISNNSEDALKEGYIAAITTFIFNKLYFPLQGFQGQTGQAEDGGLGLKPSPYDQVVLWLGRGSEEVGGVADQTLDQRRRQHCVPPGSDVISGRIMRAGML